MPVDTFLALALAPDILRQRIRAEARKVRPSKVAVVPHGNMRAFYLWMIIEGFLDDVVREMQSQVLLASMGPSWKGPPSIT